jgi:hypothetical protein
MLPSGVIPDLEVFWKDFYVICGSARVTVTLRSTLLFIATHYLIKHHCLGNPRYAASTCSHDGSRE